jgi:hypothetical protein
VRRSRTNAVHSLEIDAKLTPTSWGFLTSVG